MPILAAGRVLRTRLGSFMSQELERALEYRARAEELLRQCERQTDELTREVLLDLTATYHRMANQIEEILRMDIEAKNKAKDA